METYTNFGKMVTPRVITVMWVVGACILIILGLVILAQGTAQGIFAGLLVITLGNLVWRMACEITVLFFMIYDRLGEIRDRKD